MLMQKLFTIPYGDGAGRLHYRPNPMGVDIDLFPGKFIRDRGGNFVFLELAPYSRVCRFAPSGELLGEFAVAALLPDSVARVDVKPREIFATGDGKLSILVTASAGDSSDTYLLFADAGGPLQDLVLLHDFDIALFDAGSSALDSGGYLWALHAGGPTRVFSPEGALFAEFDLEGSFVDPSGLMYTLTEPIRLCERKGRVVKEFRVEGTATPPDFIDGGHRRTVFHVRRAEDVLDDHRWHMPKSLDLYRADKAAGLLTFLRSVELPDTILTQPNLGIDILYRTEVWGPRVLLEEDGSLYLLGRSEESCWMARIDTGVS